MAITEKLRAFADLQYRHVNYELNGFRNNPGIRRNEEYNFFNPKAGLTFQLNDQQHVYASFAIGNKEPNRDDFEVSATETPEHETLRNLEAGYVLHAQNAGLQANVYYMNYKNQLVLTGRINDVAHTPGPIFLKATAWDWSWKGITTFARSLPWRATQH